MWLAKPWIFLLQELVRVCCMSMYLEDFKHVTPHIQTVITIPSGNIDPENLPFWEEDSLPTSYNLQVNVAGWWLTKSL